MNVKPIAFGAFKFVAADPNNKDLLQRVAVMQNGVRTGGLSQSIETKGTRLNSGQEVKPCDIVVTLRAEQSSDTPHSMQVSLVEKQHPNCSVRITEFVPINFATAIDATGVVVKRAVAAVVRSTRKPAAEKPTHLGSTLRRKSPNKPFPKRFNTRPTKR